MRRRDGRMRAAERALMNSGAAKLFKQILDRQGREARETAPPKPRRPKGRTSDSPESEKGEHGT